MATNTNRISRTATSQHTSLKPIPYGDGISWTGAVIQTKVTVGTGSNAISLSNGNAAIAYTRSANMFRSADGILGLAYAPLDDAFTMPRDTWRHKYTSTQVRAGRGGPSSRISPSSPARE
jgi:Eukaryotic aspartyl protease